MPYTLEMWKYKTKLFMVRLRWRGGRMNNKAKQFSTCRIWFLVSFWIKLYSIQYTRAPLLICDHNLEKEKHRLLKWYFYLRRELLIWRSMVRKRFPSKKCTLLPLHKNTLEKKYVIYSWDVSDFSWEKKYL